MSNSITFYRQTVTNGGSPLLVTEDSRFDLMDCLSAHGLLHFLIELFSEGGDTANKFIASTDLEDLCTVDEFIEWFLELTGHDKKDEDLKEILIDCLMILAISGAIEHKYLLKGRIKLDTSFVETLTVDEESQSKTYSKYQQEVFTRDNHTCVYCGVTENLTLDHFIAQSKGGLHSPSNLVTSCKSCNSSKGDMHFWEWQAKKKLTEIV